MSTKTVALESSVYEKLALQKRDSESFTKTINRLLDAAGTQGTCAEAVAAARAIWGKPLDESERARFEDVIRSNRAAAKWESEPLR